MSLRLRLVLLIVALVAVVGLALSLLQLSNLIDSASSNAIALSRLTIQETFALLQDRLLQHAAEYRNATTQDEFRDVTYNIISTDEDIGVMLLKTMAVSPDYIVEINVTRTSDDILASSDPKRVNSKMAPLQDIEMWTRLPFHKRFWNLITRHPDFQMLLSGGENNRGDFKVQVVTSAIILRAALLAEMSRLGLVFGGALIITLFVTVLATDRVLQPVKRIESTIDRIAQGGAAEIEASQVDPEPARARRSRHTLVWRDLLDNDRKDFGGKGLAKEFAVVENKLNLLGAQFRGAREHATELRGNIDKLLERMASQLDVATRLAAISKLTNGVAHEIKNPLNAIALHLDLLREKEGGSDEVLSKEIDILSNEVRRLNRVVKTFLDFSRPVDVHFQDLDLAALAKEVVDLMTPQARLARISFALDTPPEPARLRADPDMIKQAILNLVTNAMEAMKDGGELRVKVGRPDGAVSLEVADSGPGIPEKFRDKVFQLYFTTKTRGSGIGLAMTYRAVQLHNGTIAFDSEEGKGTTFRLQFPAVVQHA